MNRLSAISPDSSSDDQPPFAQALAQARNELLDLTLRNRALSLRPDAKSARVLHIVDELSAQVYERLVEKSRQFTFHPASEQSAGTPPPDDIEDSPADPESDKRHSDSHLQTTLTADALAKRLVALDRDARTAIEEQGANLLFLSLGQLVWYEDEQSEVALHAPLVFVPVHLSRKADAESESRRFQLAVREGEEIFGNVSLSARLKQSFGIDLPAPETEEETFSIAGYFQDVARKTKAMPRWRVLPDAIALGFFSFQKYLMYLDLKKPWPEGKRLEDHALFGGLLLDGLPSSEPPFPDDVAIDDLISPEKLDHVVDADSSQTLAIEKVRNGMNLVIQGPPGTGKSQTITNIIATAVLSGKRVLFVAEKMAALDVVKRRLEHEGLDPICLELHGAGQNSARMLASVMNAWHLGAPVLRGEARTIAEFTRQREAVNEVPRALHAPLLPAELTLYQIIGSLCLLEEEGVEVLLEGTETWTPAEIAKRAQAAIDFGDVLAMVGPPGTSLWRGIGADGLLHMDLAPIGQALSRNREDLRLLGDAAAALAAAITQRPPASLGHLADQVTIGEALISAPDGMDRAAIADAVWDCGRSGLAELLDHGQRLSEALTATEGKLSPIAYERDWTTDRTCLAARKGSLFKYLSASYRRARKALAGVLAGPQPKNDDERIALLDTLLTIARCRARLAAGQDLAHQAFGSLWCGEQTNWEQTRAVLGWAEAVSRTGLGQEFRSLVRTGPSKSTITAALARLIPARTALLAGLQALSGRLVLDWQAAFGAPLDEIAFTDLAARLEGWIDKRQSLPDWSKFLRSRQALEGLGLRALVQEAVVNRLDPALVETSFRRSLYSALVRGAIRDQAVLAHFEGARHNRVIAEFRDADRQRLDVARHRVLAAHHARLPGSADRIGDIGFIRGEAERKRNRRSIRTILRRAGGLVQSIKPVFLMSPLSVAQYLEPGAVEFDLLVIDEASQIKPVDALGAIARARQVVVVGDSKQLPPTSFFERLSSGGDEEVESDAEDNLNGLPAPSKTAAAQAMESILSLCVARGVPETCLRWHYRSRHHSLIAVSNSEFYDNSLFIVPSPFQSGHGGLGIRFHAVEGCYDRAHSRTNRQEALRVVAAIQDHARECPAVTLGVATFSTVQRDMILDELERTRRADPLLDAFIARDCHEPFFVKNLESVQGDERDVIFISVGYGRDASGYMSTNFGPVNGLHGARRLNVLFSRAKYRCEVFSSITDADIDIRENSASRGVLALKSYLRFARTGLLDTPRATGRDEDTPFETSVLRAIEAMGYDADTQVGQSGFFIDLAVIDPDRPGRYLLGVECDGVFYHSSRFARERDRLRQAVLESQGWRIHRIWSTDWFKQPDQAKEKLRAHMESLRAHANRDGAPSEARTAPSPTPAGEHAATADAAGSPVHSLAAASAATARHTVTRAAPDDDPDARIGALAAPYAQATGEARFGNDPVASIKTVVTKVLAAEAPIHRDELERRCRDFFGLARVAGAFEQQVRSAVRALERAQSIIREGDFFRLPQTQTVPRNRSAVTSPALRKPSMIAPDEYDAAIRVLLRYCHGAGADEVAVGVARLFGFKTTSAQLREYTTKSLARLARAHETQTDAEGVIRPA